MAKYHDNKDALSGKTTPKNQYCHSDQQKPTSI